MSESTIHVDGQTEKTDLSVEEVVETLVTESDYNAYGIHKIVNSVFEIFEFDKKIPPQYMYNYSRNGMIVKGRGSQKSPNTNHSYNDAEVVAFVIKFCKKQMAK